MDLESDLQLAETAAKKAGENLNADILQYRQVNANPGRDVKLQADLEAEKTIKEFLAAESTYPFIGEEGGGDTELLNQAQPYWVVDPLDGTYNYLRRLPICCVSIALFQGLKPLLGCIYDFNRNEIFSGIATGKFYFNGEPTTPTWANSIEQASLATGFPAEADLSPEALKKFVHEVQSFKKVRMIGSAALALAYVAAGRFDAYHEQGTRLWDIGAGLALVQAAGGHTTLDPILNKSLAYNVWATGSPEFIV